MSLFFPFFALADEAEQDEPREEYFEAEVIEVVQEEEVEREDGTKTIQQVLKLKGLEGRFKDIKFTFDGFKEIDVKAKNIYKKGDRVVISYLKDVEGNDKFLVVDYVRRSQLYLLAAVFVLVTVLVGRWQGFKSLVGLFISYLVILKFIIPQILKGSNPLLIAILGGTFILFVTIYIIYGFQKKAHVALSGTVACLIITGIISIIFTNLTRLTGFASEESLYLISLGLHSIDLKGILLAGFIIGALGILDDITVNQASVVESIYKTDPRIRRLKAFKEAMKVGIDHISSIINTLFLAYTGAALPLLMLFSVGPENLSSFSTIINNEIIATEIIRVLVGSIGIILAVPITTFLAAYFLREKKSLKEKIT